MDDTFELGAPLLGTVAASLLVLCDELWVWTPPDLMRLASANNHARPS